MNFLTPEDEFLTKFIFNENRMVELTNKEARTAGAITLLMVYITISRTILFRRQTQEKMNVNFLNKTEVFPTFLESLGNYNVKLPSVLTKNFNL